MKVKGGINMAFKKFNEYVENKNGMFFTLPYDKDYADVIFLYQSIDDVLIATTHYISTPGYKGYAHCLDDNCPACNYVSSRGGRIQRRDSLFIPVFNLTKRRFEFWDRTPNFEHVLHESVFKNYPNPSEYVFRVTRNGQPRDVNTTYTIAVTGRNTMPYEQILSENNISFPDSYSLVCKELTYEEMDRYLNSSAPAEVPDYTYTPVPRGTNAASNAEAAAPVPDLPEINVDTPVYNQPPADIPEADTSTAQTDDLSDELGDVAF